MMRSEADVACRAGRSAHSSEVSVVNQLKISVEKGCSESFEVLLEDPGAISSRQQVSLSSPGRCQPDPFGLVEPTMGNKRKSKRRQNSRGYQRSVSSPAVPEEVPPTNSGLFSSFSTLTSLALSTFEANPDVSNASEAGATYEAAHKQQQPAAAVAASQAELASLRKELAASRAELSSTVSSHKVKLSSLRYELQEAKDMLQNTKTMHEATEIQNRDLVRSRDDMQSRLVNSEAIREGLQDRVSTLEAASATEREMHAKRASMLELQIQAALQEKGRHAERLDVMEANMLEKDDKIKVLAEEAVICRDHYEKQLMEIKSLAEDIKRDREKLQGDLDMIGAERDGLKEKLQTVTHAEAGVRDTLLSTENKIAQMKRVVSEAVSNANNLKMDLDKSVMNLCASRKAFEEVNEELVSVKDTLSNSEEALKVALRDTKVKESLISELKGSIQEKDELIAKVSNELHVSCSEISQMSMETASRLADLEGIIQAKDSSISQLSRQVGTLLEKEATSKKEQQASLDKVRAGISATSAAEIAALEKSLEQKDEQLKSCSAELQSTQDDLIVAKKALEASLASENEDSKNDYILDQLRAKLSERERDGVKASRELDGVRAQHVTNEETQDLARSAPQQATDAVNNGKLEIAQLKTRVAEPDEKLGSTSSKLFVVQQQLVGSEEAHELENRVSAEASDSLSRNKLASSRLESKLTEQKMELEKAISDLSSARQKLEESDQAHKASMIFSEQTTQELSGVKTKLMAREEEIGNISLELAAVRKDLMQSKEACALANAAVEDTISKSKMQTTALEAKLLERDDALQKTSTELHKVRHELAQRLETLQLGNLPEEESGGFSKLKLNQLGSEIAEKDALLEEHSENLRKMQNELADIVHAHAVATSAVGKANDEISKLQLESTGLRSELASREECLQKTSTELIFVQKELEKSKEGERVAKNVALQAIGSMGKNKVYSERALLEANAGSDATVEATTSKCSSLENRQSAQGDTLLSIRQQDEELKAALKWASEEKEKMIVGSQNAPAEFTAKVAGLNERVAVLEGRMAQKDNQHLMALEDWRAEQNRLQQDLASKAAELTVLHKVIKAMERSKGATARKPAVVNILQSDKSRPEADLDNMKDESTSHRLHTEKAECAQISHLGNVGLSGESQSVADNASPEALGTTLSTFRQGTEPEESIVSSTDSKLPSCLVYAKGIQSTSAGLNVAPDDENGAFALDTNNLANVERTVVGLKGTNARERRACPTERTVSTDERSSGRAHNGDEELQRESRETAAIIAAVFFGCDKSLKFEW